MFDPTEARISDKKKGWKLQEKSSVGLEDCFLCNRSRSKGLTSDGKGVLNRRISNKEQQNVEGQFTSPLDIPCSIFCGSFLLGMIGER